MKILIDSDNCDQRIDKFLSKTYDNLPYSFICKCLRKGVIKLNKKKICNDYRLKINDEISVFLTDKVIYENKVCVNDYDKLFEYMKNIPIVYEDENILLVNKPSGIIVHEDKYNKQYNLINIVKAYLYKQKSYDPYDKLTSFSPALCNRIDRNTSGIVIIAKNFQSLKILNKYIQLNQIKKKYIAVIIGTSSKKSFIIDNYLYKNKKLNKVFVSEKKDDINNKQAITKCNLLKTNNKLSLLECELITGRTHQIRVQLANLGLPILGDSKYGIDTINKEYSMFYQCLCSYSINFDFKDYSHLNYLNNKTFSIDINDIIFMKKVKQYFDKEYIN